MNFGASGEHSPLSTTVAYISTAVCAKADIVALAKK